MKTFIVGMSPACVDDTQYPCLSLSNVHSWETVGIWANQSIIKPMWGNYGGETGVILQYLSLGEEVVAWTRRTGFSSKCSDPWNNFVIACSERGGKIDEHTWYSYEKHAGPNGTIEMVPVENVYDAGVNRFLPRHSS